MLRDDGRSLRSQANPGRGMARRHPVPFLLMWAPTLELDPGRQRFAWRQPGPDVVDDRDHEDRSGRQRAARPGDGPERVRRATWRWPSRRWRRAGLRRATACDRSRSTWESPSSSSGSGCRRCLVARRRLTSRWNPRWRPSRRANAARGVLADHGRRPQPVDRQSSRAREQPQRRHGVGLFPLVFAGAHMSLEQIGTLAAIYPATWGMAQLGTGALSDRIGRKWLIASGMWVQAAGLAVISATSELLRVRVRRHPSRPWHGDGLSHAARGDR